jgi:hypothetical protein
VIQWFFEIKGNADKEAERLAESIEKVRIAADKTPTTKLGGEIDELGKMLQKVPIPGFQALGGAMGGAGDTMAALANPISGTVVALGGMAVGAAAVTAAVGLTATAIFELVIQANDWLDALEEAGVAPDFVTPEQVAAIRDASVALETLGTASETTGIALAGSFAADVTSAIEATTGFMRNLGLIAEMVGGSGGLLDLMLELGPAVALAIGPQGAALLKTFENLRDIGREYRNEVEATTDTMAEMLGFAAKGDFDTARVTDQAAEASKRAAEARRAEAAATAQAAKDMRDLIAAMDEGMRMRGAFEAKAAADAKALTEGLETAMPTDGVMAALQAIDVPTSAEIDASMARVEASLTAEIKQANMDGAMSAVSNIAGALQGGLGGILTALGPAGAIAATVIELLPQLSTLIDDAVEQAFGFVRDLPGILETLLSETLPDLLVDLPDLVSEIVGSIDEIVLAIVAAAPELILAVATLPLRIMVEFYKAIPDMVRGFIDGFGQMLRDMWEAVKEFFSNLFRGDKSKTTGTNILDGRLFGLDISPDDQGWFGAFKGDGGGGSSRRLTQDTGDLARSQSSQMSQVLQRGGNAQTVNVQIGTVVGNNEEAMRQIADGLRRQLGSYGIGTSLDPVGG